MKAKNERKTVEIIKLNSNKQRNHGPMFSLADYIEVKESVDDIILDDDSVYECYWTNDQLDRKRQIADELGCWIAYICPPVAVSDPGKIREEMGIAADWASEAADHFIWSTMLQDDAAIRLNLEERPNGQLLGETMKAILLCDLVIVTCATSVIVSESVAFKFAQMRMVPIFDVSNDPIRLWSHKTNSFKPFCNRDEMYEAIGAVMADYHGVYEMKGDGEAVVK